MNPTNLMNYIASDKMGAFEVNQRIKEQYGARKYTGSVATGYDAKRQESPKWKAEQNILEGIICGFPGATFLDVPVGTGRLIPAYERNGHKWIGVDLSGAMLAEANAKITKPELAMLLTGDVTKLAEIMGGNSVDIAFCIRLTRWLTPEQRFEALKQLQRVTDDKIVFTARVANHPYAYPVEDIEAALEPGWMIANNIEAGEPDYRVIVLGHEA